MAITSTTERRDRGARRPQDEDLATTMQRQECDWLVRPIRLIRQKILCFGYRTSSTLAGGIFGGTHKYEPRIF